MPQSYGKTLKTIKIKNLVKSQTLSLIKFNKFRPNLQNMM